MSSPKSAFVIGATGAVGRRLVDALVESKDFNRVVVFARRNVNDFPASNKLELKVVDFDKIEAYADDFKGLDVGFSCMGTTRAQVNQQDYYKIDHDYVVNTAKVAKDQGVKQIAIVSSKGADRSSFFNYPKFKGQIEDDVAAVGFEKTIITRPGVLEARPDGTDTGRGAFAAFLMKPLKMISNSWAITCEDVAKAMIVAVQDSSLQGKAVLENADLVKNAKKFQA